MKKLILLLSAVALSLGAAACQQDTKKTEAKIDELSKQVASLEAKIDKLAASGVGAGRPGQPPARQRRPEPAPTDVLAVPVDGAAAVGPADALVTIVKGYEYACPYCEKVNPTIEQLHKDYGNKIRVVYKHFVVHPQVATDPALAVCAATRQGKFQQMDKLVWEKAYAVRKFDRANMEALAKEAGLDMAKFKADMDGDCKSIIAKDQAELQAAGQGATPTFFINGRYMSGAQPLPQFKAIIDDEIKKAEERIAAGTPRGDYYKVWVMEKGMKKFVPKVEAPAK
jgi:protein-disulfide isomerase